MALTLWGDFRGEKAKAAPARWELEQLEVTCQCAGLNAAAHMQLAVEILYMCFHGIE